MLTLQWLPFLSDGLVNSLVLNSGYILSLYVAQFKDEGASSEAYGKMDTDEMLRIVKAAVGALKVIIFQRRFQP